MKKLSIGLLAAVAIAIAAAPADAATKKKKSGGKKAAAQKEQVAKVPEAHPMYFTCYLNAWFGAKQPKACGG